MIKNKFILIAGALLILLVFNSCLQDLVPSTTKTQITISFDAPTFVGRSFVLNTNNANEDLQFYTNKNATKVYCQPLSSEDNRSMKSSSSVNFAWQGSTENGAFSAINFNNSSALNSGDIELSYTDGEFITANIPVSSILNIQSYGAEGELVEGNSNFQTLLIYEKNGQTSQFNTTCYLNFKIRRGPDKN